MVPCDERILEALAESRISSPSELHDQFEFYASLDRVEERCRVLASVGFVEWVWEDPDILEITTDGKQYLKGEVDARHRTPSRWALRG
jgi:hypothetical protein